MSSQEKYPVPSAETSLKFMSWHLKENSESAKVTALALRSIDESLKSIAEYFRLSKEQKRIAPSSRQEKMEPYYSAREKIEEIPF